MRLVKAGFHVLATRLNRHSVVTFTGFLQSVISETKSRRHLGTYIHEQQEGIIENPKRNKRIIRFFSIVFYSNTVKTDSFRQEYCPPNKKKSIF